jgi:TRAP-type C4-dicarboxylate transport system permease small subunit
MSMAEGSKGHTAVLTNVTWINIVVRACEVVTTLALAAMVLVIVIDVITRNLFGFSLQVSDELCGYFLVVATFVAMPVALANDAIHKVHFVEDRFSERTRLILQIFVAIVALAVCLIIEWSLARLVVLSFRNESAAMTDLNTPLWIPQAAMPIGFGLLCVVMAALIVVKIKQFRTLSPAHSSGK